MSVSFGKKNLIICILSFQYILKCAVTSHHPTSTSWFIVDLQNYYLVHQVCILASKAGKHTKELFYFKKIELFARISSFE